MGEEESEVVVRPWARLAGRAVEPTPASTAVLLGVFLAAVVSRGGHAGEPPLVLAYVVPGGEVRWVWILWVGAAGLGLAAGSASSAAVGGATTLAIATILLALGLPLGIAAMLLPLGMSATVATTMGSMVLGHAAAGASTAAAWALIAVPHARRPSVPAVPFVVAACGMLLLPAAERASEWVALLARLGPLVAVAPVVAVLGGWAVWAWSPTAPRPSERPAPEDALLAAVVLVGGSALCWLALWTWLPPYENVLPGHHPGGPPGAVRPACIALAGLVTTLAAWRAPRVDSLTWLGAGFVLTGAAVAVTLTPWWGSVPAAIAAAAAYEAGRVVVLAMIARWLTERTPAPLVPLALGGWLAVMGLHDAWPGDLLGVRRAMPLYRVPDLPIALACATWGAALFLVRRAARRYRARSAPVPMPESGG